MGTQSPKSAQKLDSEKIYKEFCARIKQFAKIMSMDEISCKDLEIAFNARYLVDIFKNIGSGSVVMSFTTNVSPCILRPEGSGNTYLVLPVRVYGA